MPVFTTDVSSIIADFDRDGFAVVESLLSTGEIAAMASGVNWAIATLPGHPWIKPRSYEWNDAHPIFLKLIAHPVVLEFADAWLGTDFHLIAAQCSRNTRDDCYAPGAMQWHQDSVFFPADRAVYNRIPADRVGFSAMWYVQDTPLEMGPTSLLPGSQQSESGPGDEVEAANIYWRPFDAGTLLLFNHRTWHTGRPNMTDVPRDLITNAYAVPDIDKVQLMTAQTDCAELYIEPTSHVEQNATMARLMRKRL